jgi:palmitoyl protein thioesterase
MGYNTLVSTFILLFTLVISLLFTTPFVVASNTNFTTDPNIAAFSKAKMATLLDPNPVLIDKHGNLIQDTTLLSKLKSRNGTIADGVSKLIIQVNYSRPLNFSIVDKSSNILSDGTLSPLLGPSIKKPSSSTVVNQTNNGTSVVAVYTPPDFINETTAAYKNIKLSINDPTNSSATFSPVDIKLYHPPVVLVHGIWETPTIWTDDSNFSQYLIQRGFNISLANYSAHYATTFDPAVHPNYGIDSINNTISKVFQEYHKNAIAASQADMIGHSMGGLMIRGFAQQPYYKNQANFMKGYIHRLITIGTPNFGANLANILDSHKGYSYCYGFSKHLQLLIFPTSDTKSCKSPLTLETIYNKIHIPIDQGGVEALIPGSVAYSHLCPTNVTSYSIVGDWKPNGIHSRDYLQRLFQNITGNPNFRIDEDGFHGDNDLQVNTTSQAGGLSSIIQQGQNGNIPRMSETVHNIVHAKFLVNDTGVNYEVNSTQVQNDVSKLLNSNDSVFADSIGNGSPCDISKK